MHYLEFFLTVLASVLASSGFWAFIQNKRDKKDAKTLMILGIGYQQIRTIGNEYIHRGWISLEEYNEFIKYLYSPYKALNGDGAADRIKETLSHLPSTPTNQRKDEHNEAGYYQERQG